MQTVHSLDEYRKLAGEHPACLFYFSHEDCQVCKVLRPKVRQMILDDFPATGFFYVDIRQTPDVAAQHSVLAVPTLILYLEGKESLRVSRHVSLDELHLHFSRWYPLLFP